jgi:DNA-binding NarL/FixJ family response regulator
VKFHISNLLPKIGVQDRHELLNASLKNAQGA